MKKFILGNISEKDKIEILKTFGFLIPYSFITFYFKVANWDLPYIILYMIIAIPLFIYLTDFEEFKIGNL